MFIAMNRFRIVPGQEEAFEAMWRARDSRLREMDGFVEFKLLRGSATDEHTLYISHSTWRDAAAFEAWTRSAQFRHAHSGAGDSRPFYVGGPHLELFESVIES